MVAKIGGQVSSPLFVTELFLPFIFVRINKMTDTPPRKLFTMDESTPGFVQAVKSVWNRTTTMTTGRAEYVADCFNFYEDRSPTRDVKGNINCLISAQDILVLIQDTTPTVVEQKE